MKIMTVAFSFALAAMLALTRLAIADPKVVKARHDDIVAKVTLAAKSPRAGEDVALTIELHHHASRTTSAPVTDATVQAHLAHGKDRTEVALAHDAAVAGTYAGNLVFEHAGKETFHVGIKLPNKQKEWLIRVAVTVKKPAN